MRCRRQIRDAPAWVSDARVRQQINEQIKQRRAKRIRALAALEIAIREPQQREPQINE